MHVQFMNIGNIPYWYSQYVLRESRGDDRVRGCLDLSGVKRRSISHGAHRGRARQNGSPSHPRCPWRLRDSAAQANREGALLLRRGRFARPAFQRSEARAVLLLERFRGGFAFSAGSEARSLPRERRPAGGRTGVRIKRIDPDASYWRRDASDRGAGRHITRRWRPWHARSGCRAGGPPSSGRSGTPPASGPRRPPGSFARPCYATRGRSPSG